MRRTGASEPFLSQFLRLACSRPSSDARARWPDLLQALRDETDTEIAEGVLAAELVSGLTGQPAKFVLLSRNVGPASTEISYELVSAGICFRREFSDEPDDGGQRSVRTLNVSEFRGLPRGVTVETSCDHALYPTLTVVVRGAAADAQARIVAGVRQAFSSVAVRQE